MSRIGAYLACFSPSSLRPTTVSPRSTFAELLEAVLLSSSHLAWVVADDDADRDRDGDDGQRNGAAASGAFRQGEPPRTSAQSAAAGRQRLVGVVTLTDIIRWIARPHVVWKDTSAACRDQEQQ